MHHTTQGMVHDDSTEAPMHHATTESGMGMDHGHHESTMAMMDHDKTTMGMHHETTTSDNEEEDALEELGEMGMEHDKVTTDESMMGHHDSTTQPMMLGHEEATTIKSVQTTAIDDDAADALGVLDDMGDMSDHSGRLYKTTSLFS